MLDLAALGLEVEADATGRPGYHPALMLEDLRLLVSQSGPIIAPTRARVRSQPRADLADTPCGSRGVLAEIRYRLEVRGSGFNRPVTKHHLIESSSCLVHLVSVAANRQTQESFAVPDGKRHPPALFRQDRPT